MGDDPCGDVAGAAAAGLRTVWIDWERKAYPVDLQAPGYTIARFEQLLALLPSPARIS